jgi:hypothetical protein
MLALNEHLDPPLPYDTTDCHANRPRRWSQAQFLERAEAMLERDGRYVIV